MQEYREYARILAENTPHKTTTRPNGQAHVTEYHWREDGSYIIGCVRRNNGIIVEIIKTVNFDLKP